MQFAFVDGSKTRYMLDAKIVWIGTTLKTALFFHIAVRRRENSRGILDIK